MDRLSLRRAIERLRDGLFDPYAVACLTVEKDGIEQIFSKGLQAVEKGKASPLCICGSYGQGKSHTLTYLKQLALSQGYATSIVSLDAREIPFHQWSVVYRSLMETLTLPSKVPFTKAWRNGAGKEALQMLDPMPHRFKMTLTAMLCKSRSLTPKEKSQKKHQAYRPKDYDDWLDKALMGYDIPLTHLKNICKYREVEGYLTQSLTCRDNALYVQMIQSLGKVYREMGSKGWVLFFDEAESIAQGRLGHRVKSYQLLDQFFQTQGFVFPVFACTNDFFDRVHHESYDDPAVFPKNYAQEWKDVPILHLTDFSSCGWDALTDRLMQLYSQAYQIDLPLQVKPSLQSLLVTLEGQETRIKLKALVNKL
jgi:hypothetical protein